MTVTVTVEDDRVVIAVPFTAWRRLKHIVMAAVLGVVGWAATLMLLGDGSFGDLFILAMAGCFAVMALLIGLKGLCNGGEVWDCTSESVEYRHMIAGIARRRWDASVIEAINLGSIGFKGDNLFLILVTKSGGDIHLPRMSVARCRDLFEALKDVYPQAHNAQLEQLFAGDVAAAIGNLKPRR